MIGTYVIEGVLLVLVLAAFIPIVREEWQGRGVFRWHDSNQEEES